MAVEPAVESAAEFKPYVPDQTVMPEFTVSPWESARSSACSSVPRRCTWP